MVSEAPARQEPKPKKSPGGGLAAFARRLGGSPRLPAILTSLLALLLVPILWLTPSGATLLWQEGTAGLRGQWRAVLLVTAAGVTTILWVREIRKSEHGGRWLARVGVVAALLCIMVATIAVGIWVYTTTPSNVASSASAVVGRPVGRAAITVQTTALVAGLGGAALTLWLNDRRRRHDQQVLAHERAKFDADRARFDEERLDAIQRLSLERTRTMADRFAKSIELLGHTEASVRVGAMHALVGLVEAEVDRTQTVIDVLSAYVRQPFMHPSWRPRPAQGRRVRYSERDALDLLAADRELEVRRTAVRLIRSLLPFGEGEAFYRVDLSRANLENLSFTRCNISAQFEGVHVYGRAQFWQTRFLVLNLDDAVFHGQASFFRANLRNCSFERVAFLTRRALFSRAQFRDRADFSGSFFFAEADFSKATFARALSFSAAHLHGGIDLRDAAFTSVQPIDWSESDVCRPARLGPATASKVSGAGSVTTATVT